MPDTSKQQALLADQDKALKAQELATQQKQAAALKAKKLSAKSSLLTGGEAGVLKETLG